MIKIKCIFAPSNSLLTLGKIYTVSEKSKNNRYFVNVFEGMENEYAPMYGSFNDTNFEIVE